MTEVERETTHQIIPAVGVLVFRGKKVLLVRHLQKSQHINNMYGLPAGRKDYGEIERTTAVRELFEETGLKTTEEYLVPFPHNIYMANFDRKDANIMMSSLQVFICTKYSGFLHGTDETDPVWMPLSQLASLHLLPNVERAIKEGMKFMEGLRVKREG